MYLVKKISKRNKTHNLDAYYPNIMKTWQFPQRQYSLESLVDPGGGVDHDGGEAVAVGGALLVGAVGAVARELLETRPTQPLGPRPASGEGASVGRPCLLMGAAPHHTCLRGAAPHQTCLRGAAPASPLIS